MVPRARRRRGSPAPGPSRCIAAMIDAAKATVFVAAQKQRGAAMRKALIQYPDLPGAVAKGDKLFAEKQKPHRIAIDGGRGRTFESCRVRQFSMSR